MSARLGAALLSLASLGCDQAPCEGCPANSASPSDGAAFDEASLEPPFEHNNAIWAGVAILDYDGDGRQDLFFTNGKSHPDALYRNEGDGRFVDVAVDVGLGSLEQHGAASAGDLDNDGDEDLVVAIECSYGSLAADGGSLPDGGAVVYLNDGEGRFAEARIEADWEVCPVSVELADVDDDGFLDLILNSGIDPDRTYPWIFEKVVSEAIDHVLLGDGAGGFSAEVPIEPLGGWGAELPSEGDGGGGGFVEPETYQFVTFTSAMADLNGDGVNERLAGMGGGPLEVYSVDDGELSLVEGSQTGRGLWMGLAVADYDGDGDLDVYATNQGVSPMLNGYDNFDETADRAEPLPYFQDQAPTPFHTLMLNEGGALAPAADWPVTADHLLAGDLFEGVEDLETGELRYAEWLPIEDLERYPWSWGAVSADFDADGWPDVAFTSNSCAAPMDIIWDEERGAGPGGLLLNREGAGFEDVTWEWGVANVDAEGRYVDGRGIAVGDLNGDGYPDLVFANKSYNPSESDPLSQTYGEPKVWLSRPRAGGWLSIALQGTDSNRQGIGAQVRIADGARTQVHVLGGGGATNSSSQRILLAGLGDAEVVDVEVRFPSGQVVTLEDVSADQRLVVEEP